MCLKTTFWQMCATVCERFLQNEGDIEAMLTEFGAKLTQIEAYRWQD